MFPIHLIDRQNERPTDGLANNQRQQTDEIPEEATN